MSAHGPVRASAPHVSVYPNDAPVDHALTLLLAGETETALRWGAAVLERDPWLPDAIIVTSRLLEQMGRTRAARDGLCLAVHRAVSAGDLPLAVAAISDLRTLGLDVSDLLERVACTFWRGATRLQAGGRAAGLAPSHEFLQPLSPFLTGPTLASRATQVLQAAKRAYDEGVGAPLSTAPGLPLFGSLSKEALRGFLGALRMITVPAGHMIVREGDDATAAYIVARGEVEISRRAAPGPYTPPLALAHAGDGAVFGEMALLCRVPSPVTATATRPSILLVADRDALAAVSSEWPEVATQLAAHCRRNSLANLGWTSSIVVAVPPEERAEVIERLEMRAFKKGDKLARDGEDATGLYVIVSGEVAIVAREWSGRVLLARLGSGEIVGEVELVLCRQVRADAIAVRPTTTLFLSRDEYTALVRDHPAVLHGLYAIAVRRHAEAKLALQAGTAVVAEDWLLDDEPTGSRFVPAASVPGRAPRARALPPPPPPPPATTVSASSVGPPATTPPSIPPTSASLRPSRLGVRRGASAVRAAALLAAALFAFGSAAAVLSRYGRNAPSTVTRGAAAATPAVASEVAVATTTVVSVPTPPPTAAAPPTATLPTGASAGPHRPRSVRAATTPQASASAKIAAATTADTSATPAPLGSAGAAHSDKRTGVRATSAVDDDFGGRQ